MDIYDESGSLTGRIDDDDPGYHGCGPTAEQLREKMHKRLYKIGEDPYPKPLSEIARAEKPRRDLAEDRLAKAKQDIVYRLREMARSGDITHSYCKVVFEAVDEIESLRSHIEELNDGSH